MIVAIGSARRVGAWHAHSDMVAKSWAGRRAPDTEEALLNRRASAGLSSRTDVKSGSRFGLGITKIIGASGIIVLARWRSADRLAAGLRSRLLQKGRALVCGEPLRRVIQLFDPPPALRRQVVPGAPDSGAACRDAT